MREAIDTTANFEVDPAVVHVFVKVLFVYELLRNVSEMDADISRAVQWGFRVKVSDIKGKLFGTLVREDTLDYELEKIKLCSFGSQVAQMFGAITANHDASAIGSFLGEERAHNFGVCNLLLVVFGDVIIVNDVECVGFLGPLGCFVSSGPNYMEETAEFVLVWCGPCWY